MSTSPAPEISLIYQLANQYPNKCNRDLLYKLLSGIHINERGCWIRGIDGQRYSKVRDGSRQRQAHRVSYELFYGIKLVNLGCHECDTPACINPRHVFDGTNKDNLQDAIDKDRRYTTTPELKEERKKQSKKRFLPVDNISSCTIDLRNRLKKLE